MADTAGMTGDGRTREGLVKQTAVSALPQACTVLRNVHRPVNRKSDYSKYFSSAYFSGNFF